MLTTQNPDSLADIRASFADTDPETEVVLCQVCKIDGRDTEAVKRVVETRGGVCQGHILPTLLAGYGVERL